MKKLSIFMLLLVFFLACDNDNKKLLQTLEGRWQVTSVSFSNAPSKPDSTAMPNSVYWEFEACNDQRNNNVNENCELAYYENNQKTSFTYSVIAQGGGPKTLTLRQKSIPDKQPDFERIAPFVIKAYMITQQTDNLLVLSCSNCDLSNGGKIDYRATEWHLKR